MNKQTIEMQEFKSNINTGFNKTDIGERYSKLSTRDGLCNHEISEVDDHKS